MVEAKKNERANALKEVKRLCKKFGFTAGMLKVSLAEGRKKQWVRCEALVVMESVFYFSEELNVMHLKHFLGSLLGMAST